MLFVIELQDAQVPFEFPRSALGRGVRIGVDDKDVGPCSSPTGASNRHEDLLMDAELEPQVRQIAKQLHPVSYTHLTLPTNREV